MNRPAADPSAQSEARDAASRVAELRVSGHLMTLDTGVFCVFPAPGSPSADPNTGLPGVRVTRAPASKPEAVSVSTFNPDGWLDGAAALVRVTEPAAQILVTVYQSARQANEAAPRLQVLRLSGEATEAAAPAPAAPAVTAVPAPSQAAPTENPEVLAHVQQTGDVTGKIGDWVGLRGSHLWIEGFGVAPNALVGPGDIEYQGVLGRGWLSPWVEGGKFCGSRGMALPLLGLNVRLKGEAAEKFECQYSASFVDGTTVGPVPAGEPCQAESLQSLEAFQIEIRPRAGAAAAPAADRKPAARKQAAPKQPAPKQAAKPKTASRSGRR
ncbi:MAG: hypothetical protein AB7F35_21250 [Acetobacteraceae bacterium]